jgi:hypothetical protein
MLHPCTEYTTEASLHLWCAESLAAVLTGEGFESFNCYNDDICHGVLYLLHGEIHRARKALAAESARRRSADQYSKSDA